MKFLDSAHATQTHPDGRSQAATSAEVRPLFFWELIVKVGTLGEPFAETVFGVHLHFGAHYPFSSSLSYFGTHYPISDFPIAFRNSLTIFGVHYRISELPIQFRSSLSLFRTHYSISEFPIAFRNSLSGFGFPADFRNSQTVFGVHYRFSEFTIRFRNSLLAFRNSLIDFGAHYPIFGVPIRISELTIRFRNSQSQFRNLTKSISEFPIVFGTPYPISEFPFHFAAKALQSSGLGDAWLTSLDLMVTHLQTKVHGFDRFKLRQSRGQKFPTLKFERPPPSRRRLHHFVISIYIRMREPPENKCDTFPVCGVLSNEGICG